MSAKFFLPQILIVLIISIQLAISTAEETTIANDLEYTTFSPTTVGYEEPTPTEEEKLYIAIIDDLMTLMDKFKDITNIYKNRISEPKVFPNILDVIENNPDIISIKATLNSIQPTSPKFAKRKRCEKLFDVMVRGFIDHLEDKMVKISDEQLETLRNRLVRIGQSLKNLSVSLRQIDDEYLEQCSKDDTCFLTFAFNNYARKNIEEVGKSLKNHDGNLKNYYYYRINAEVMNSLAPTIHNCLVY